MRQAAMLSAPVPHASTLAATVPVSGLRATTTGSNAARLPPAAGEVGGVPLVALPIAVSVRVAREFNTAAANIASTAPTKDDNPSGLVGSVVVLSGVICDRQDHKVSRSVVVLDVVPVVDVLVASQSSAQHAFHDVTVFQNVAPVNSDADVAVAADEPPAAPVGVVLAGAASRRIAALAGAVAVLASGES